MEGSKRKKVKLEFRAASSSKGGLMKKPEKKPQVPLVISKVKKNYINKFVRLMKEGTASKVTSSQTKLIVDQNVGHVKIRQLGPILDTLLEGSPSVLVEMVGEGDFFKDFKEMQSKMQSMEGEVKSLKGEVKSLKSEVKSLKSEVKVLEEFHNDGLEISLRTFLDKVLECFYIHAGMGNLESEERSRWLKSEEAQDFVKGRSEMALFQGTSVKVSGKLLKLLRDAKHSSSMISVRSAHSSSMISVRSAHSSKPIRVAMALRDLESFKGKADYHWLFRQTFGMSADAMVTKWHSGELEQVHTTRFALERRGPV